MLDQYEFDDYDPDQFIQIQFPKHEHKAAIESYVTKGTACHPKGILYTRARNSIRFGFRQTQLNPEAKYFEFKLKLRY